MTIAFRTALAGQVSGGDGQGFPYSMWRSVKWRVALSDRRELATGIVRGGLPGSVRAAAVLLALIGCDGQPRRE